MTGRQSPELNVVFSLLSNARRRSLLYLLLNSEYATVDDLATKIVAWEQGCSLREVSEDDHRRVAVSLVHVHLPRLADENVVDYDDRNGDVVTASGFDRLRPFLEDAYASEHTDELPERSHLSVLYSKPPEEPFALEDD
ncbi:DUF7344 domain-containing protein [Natrononativus amylolyticus]|uniref:DUF7344 domain-containing protein n=1 Tax=Natrononativus amylolyticus TaxID=2963434 RepID=UPI0020CDB22E|nr:hypothetical protein [Natrononativus amylolyticus]